jgi:hypothetical protein
MKKIAIAFLVIGIQLLLAGCTVRYSQTIGGSIHKADSFKVVNSESGMDIGFNGGGSYVKAANGIAFGDQLSAKETANYPCDMQFTEVDYRTRFYVYWIRIDFPKVETTTYCIKKQQ